MTTFLFLMLFDYLYLIFIPVLVIFQVLCKLTILSYFLSQLSYCEPDCSVYTRFERFVGNNRCSGSRSTW